jgi:hypothetical protein
VVNNISNYNAWSQYSNVDTGMGYITLHHRGDSAPLTFDLTSSNGLWYHNNSHNTTDYYTWSNYQGAGRPTIHRLNRAAEYSLAHLCYGCAGQQILSMVHHDVDNQPKLQMYCFFKCLACMLATGDSRDTKNTKDTATTVEFDDWFDDTTDLAQSDVCAPGQHFHVDFGFMKGSGYCKKDEEGRTITSIDGFRSYFLIIDRKTRYVWVFLTKTKQPPLTIFSQFLKEHGHPTAKN